MKRIIFAPFFAAGLALTAGALGLIANGASLAHDYQKAALVIDHPAAHPSPSLATGAVYLDIINHGEKADRLISAKTARAQAVELHQSSRDAKGVARMTVLKDGLNAPAGERTQVQPGGVHLMLIGLDAPLTDGESFPLTLEFENAGAIEVIVKVEPRKPQGTAPADHHQSHTHH